MDSFHMVMKIPPAGESISRDGPFAGGEMAEMGILSMAMHSMCFSFMAEEASIGRKMSIHALADLAAVWLQMRIKIFTARYPLVGNTCLLESEGHLLVTAFLCGWWVRTRLLVVLKGAMVFPIGLCW